MKLVFMYMDIILHLMHSVCYLRSSKDMDIMRVVVGQDSMDKTEDREMVFRIKRVFLHPDYQ
jgi:hypothetical protein